VTRAARNNAAWCSIVCATHGVDGAFAPDAWTCAMRTPEHYPDAVTLHASVDADGLLARVDATSGCSIKDSFADLDLTPRGFDPLFDATWIRRRAAPKPARATPTNSRWHVVRDPEELREWEAAWRGGEPDPGPRTFLPALLERDDVAILAIAAAGTPTTAILSLGGGVVGISNVVTAGADATEAFAIAVGAAAVLFPDLDIVGYELGSELDAARDAGFETIGPLRVWLRA